METTRPLQVPFPVSLERPAGRRRPHPSAGSPVRGRDASEPGPNSSLGSPPCDNCGTSTTGCGNSAGAGATLEAYGSSWTANQACLGASVGSVSRLVLLAEGMPAQQVCLFFQGDQQVPGPSNDTGQPFGDGLRCVETNVIKIEVVTTDAAGRAATTVDVAATGQVQVGDRKHYQARYRDPGGLCMNGFNLTNGLELLWDPSD